MAMSTLETGPKLDWTRDNQMYERYRIWKKKVVIHFSVQLLQIPLQNNWSPI